jgi:hypothetical protein
MIFFGIKFRSREVSFLSYFWITLSSSSSGLALRSLRLNSFFSFEIAFSKLLILFGWFFLLYYLSDRLESDNLFIVSYEVGVILPTGLRSTEGL